MSNKTNLFLVTFFVILYSLISMTCFSQVDDKKAVRAIIGESSGEGYIGMLAVASGIRNRGSLKGVYGLNSPHIDKEPKWVWQLAETAWLESKKNRLHDGTMWGSKLIDKKWIKTLEDAGYIKVYEWKNHVFYK